MPKVRDGTEHKSPLTTDTYLLDRNCLSKMDVDLLAACWISKAVKEATRDPRGPQAPQDPQGFPQIPAHRGAVAEGVTECRRRGRRLGKSSFSFSTASAVLLPLSEAFLEVSLLLSPRAQRIARVCGARDKKHSHGISQPLPHFSLHAAFILSSCHLQC